METILFNRKTLNLFGVDGLSTQVDIFIQCGVIRQALLCRCMVGQMNYSFMDSEHVLTPVSCYMTEYAISDYFLDDFDTTP